MNYTVGVDIGGTFTDCVVVDETGTMTIGKALSTPLDFSLGVMDAVGDAAKNLGLKSEDEVIRSTRIFFHACTVGENSLITRSGSKTGVIGTKGFVCKVFLNCVFNLLQEFLVHRYFRRHRGFGLSV